MTNKIDAKGSLELFESNGSLLVRFADWYGCDEVETLSTARHYFAIGAKRLSGSQAKTIVGWFDQHAKPLA